MLDKENTELEQRRLSAIRRVMALSDEQLEQLISLWSQQDLGSFQSDLAHHQTSA